MKRQIKKRVLLHLSEQQCFSIACLLTGERMRMEHDANQLIGVPKKLGQMRAEHREAEKLQIEIDQLIVKLGLNLFEEYCNVIRQIDVEFTVNNGDKLIDYVQDMYIKKQKPEKTSWERTQNALSDFGTVYRAKERERKFREIKKDATKN